MVAAIRPRNEEMDGRKERRFITIEEARRLLKVAGPRRLFYAVQLWTGLRVSEVRALRWSDLVLDGQWTT
jgi:integrase